MKKRVFALMLVLILLFSLAAGAAAAPVVPDCQYDEENHRLLVQNVPEGASVYAAGYAIGGKMTFARAAAEQNGSAQIDLPEAAFDQLKVFILNDNHSLICIPVQAYGSETYKALSGFEDYIEKLDLDTDSPEKQTITGAELTQMLDKVVAYAAPEKLDAWQQLYPVLRSDDRALKRIDVISALFLMGYHIGGAYAYMMPHVNLQSEEFNALTPGEEFATWDLFGGFMSFQISDWCEDHYAIAAHIYNISRTCTVDGERMMAYDSAAGTFHMQEEATCLDALLAVLRCVSLAETEQIVAADSQAAMTHSGVLSQELLEKSSANPTVTSEEHPRWTGFVLGYGYKGSLDTSAREIELTAEWGFNSARVMIHYETLFSADAQTVDLNALMELDKLVAAAIEEGIHLNLCLNALPGRWAGINENYETTGDFDLFINPEKQAQALRIYKALATRYKDVSNYNFSLTPYWEPLNKNLSTGLPFEDFDAQDVAAFTSVALDAIRAEDPDRLIIYEPTPVTHGDVSQFLPDIIPTKEAADEKGNAIISYNACETPFVYACMTATDGKHIDDMNTSMDLPNYPNYIYSVASHLTGDNTLTINGFLPAGTTVDLYLEKSYGSGTLEIRADGQSLYTEELTEQEYQVGERLSGLYPYATSDKQISLTLETDVQALVISAERGADICGISLTLPEEYARERWYYAQAYDVFLGKEEQEGVAKRTTSRILLSPNDTEHGRTVTIHEDLSYTSDHVWQEASTDTVSTWAKDINEFDGNCVIRFERGTFSGVTMSNLKAYYADLLQSYEDYGFSWWSNDWWLITSQNNVIAEKTTVEYAGYEHFNLELLQFLQQYQ